MRGTIISRAPGIARAVARPPESATSGSASPWITSVGTSIVFSSAVRSPEARIAASWRGVRPDRGRGRSWLPRGAGCLPGRAAARSSRSCRRASRSGRCTHRGPPRALEEHRQERRRGPPGPAAARVGHDRDQRRDVLGVQRGERLGDHPAHRRADDVRRCAIEFAQQRRGVAGHRRQRVGRGSPWAQRELRDRRYGASMCVERPMSRLSKRIT